MSLEFKVNLPATADSPAGLAEFWRMAELPPRKKRALDAGFMPLQGKIKALASDPDTPVSDEEALKLLQVNELAAYALLKSWTLPDPLPESADAILDLPRGVYDVLIEHAAKIMTEEVSPFSAEDAESNDQSPISA